MANIDDYDDLGIADVIDEEDDVEIEDRGTLPPSDSDCSEERENKNPADSAEKEIKEKQPERKNHADKKDSDVGTHYRDDDTISDDDVAKAVRMADDAITRERRHLIREANESYDSRKEAGRLTKEEELREEENLKHYRKNFGEVLKIGAVYAYLLVTWGIIATYVYRLINGAVNLDCDKLLPKAWVTVWLLFGICVWACSTAIKHWNYDNRIKLFFVTLLSLISTEIACTFYYLPYKILLPIFIGDVNPWVSKNDWAFLARIITIVPMLVSTIAVVTSLAKLVFDELTFYELKFLRIGNYLDLRKNKKWLYDTRKVVCRSSDARYQVVREMDRYLHSMIIGATGGGKTSSILLPMIDEDLRQRAKNDDALRSAVLKMLKKKQAYMCGPVGQDYWIKSIVAVEGYEKKLEKLKNKYRLCGITIMAPDPSLTDDAYILGVAKGDKVNRLDPIPADEFTGKKKTGYTGFNPLYISPDIPEWAHTKEIVKKATLFADVLQSIDDLRGHGDPYFTNLNRCMTVTFIICLEVAYPRLHNGKQPNPGVLRDCINNFDYIRPYYRELVRCDKEEKRYSFVTDFIATDIFGPGRDKMLDQVRGLRNLVDLLLATPSFADILCVDDEHTLDMDKMLSEGQITVVDYAYEEGVSDSTGFGLFIMLSFIDAVLRRPGNEKTRIPHFFYLDEASLLVTPRLEQAVSLFRKFRCACTFANQSLVQYERTEQTRTLKGVMISGCSQHYVFGRCGVEEMRTYSELAGINWKVTEMKAVTETSITTDNPSYSYQTREQLSKDNVLEGSAMRNLPFQELTVFSVRNGNLITPYFAKVDFLKKTKYNKIKRFTMNWDELYKEYSYTNLVPDEDTMQKLEKNIPSDTKHIDSETAGIVSAADFDELASSANNVTAQDEVKQKASGTESVSASDSKTKEAGQATNRPVKRELPEAGGNDVQTQPKQEKQSGDIGSGCEFDSESGTYIL